MAKTSAHRLSGNVALFIVDVQRGFETYVVPDATATFDRLGPDGRSYRAKDVHAINLASLHNEFAKIVDTNELLKRLDQESTH